jgi:hypothetical protein
MSDPTSVFFTVATVWGFGPRAVELAPVVGSPGVAQREPIAELAECPQPVDLLPGESPEADARPATVDPSAERAAAFANHAMLVAEMLAADGAMVLVAIRKARQAGCSRRQLRAATGLGYSRVVKVVEPLIRSGAVTAEMAPVGGSPTWVYFAATDRPMPPTD